MMTYDEIAKQLTPEEIVEVLVFPDTRSEQDREAALQALREVRYSKEFLP